MAIGGGTLKAYIDTTANASSYNTTTHGGGTWTPVVDRLYLAFVCVPDSVNPVITVSGNGLTWGERTLDPTVTMALSGDIFRAQMWVANGTGATLGNTTVSLSSGTANACQLAILEFTGTQLDTSTPNGPTKATVQVVSATAASGATSGSLTLAAASDADNRVAAMFVHEADEVASPQSGWTEVSDKHQSAPSLGMETQRRLDAFDTAAGATWANSRGWIGIAVEIAALHAFDTSVGMIPL